MGLELVPVLLVFLVVGWVCSLFCCLSLSFASRIFSKAFITFCSSSWYLICLCVLTPSGDVSSTRIFRTGSFSLSLFGS